jgi:S1-C subfamily serine protease
VQNSPYLSFGRFDALTEGDDVIYIGHPFGESEEFTSKGMISWIGKSEVGNAFALNAIVNSGNSGGPLIDIKTGRVVGIVRAKYGTLTPYLKMISEGKLIMGAALGGGNFNLEHFVTDVAKTMDLHIQMGIGYAVSTEYAEAELQDAKKKVTVNK